MKKVLGMGAALVDILANVSDEWIAANGLLHRASRRAA